MIHWGLHSKEFDLSSSTHSRDRSSASRPARAPPRARRVAMTVPERCESSLERCEVSRLAHRARRTRSGTPGPPVSEDGPVSESVGAEGAHLVV